MVGLVAAVALGVGAALLITGGGEEASAQTVRFQKPTEPGPDPFTPPTDVSSGTPVQTEQPPQGTQTQTQTDQVGAGPYGGTGSDLVCDRELLIRSLQARPDRMAEWARVRGIDPSPESVASYIRSLRPVTLTRDTRVTNYSFENGKAVGFQSILQAGTAVLVDKYGEPVVRCRCGNPLTKPIYYEKAKCLYCPPHYKPPPYCYYKYRKSSRTYTTDSSGYDRSYQPYSNCWKQHPKPPPVRTSTTRQPRTTPPPQPRPPPTETYTQEPDRRAPYTYDQDTQTQTQTTDGGTTGGGTTGGGTTGGGTTGGGTTGGGTTGGGTTGGGGP